MTCGAPVSGRNALLLSVVAALLRAQCHRNDELRQVAYFSAGAAARQAHALLDSRVAAEDTTRAVADEAEAERLRESAGALKSDARQEAEQSAALEGQAAELEEMAVSHEEGALHHAAEAALDAGISEDAAASAVEEGEAALASTVRAHKTEEGLALCQVLPGIDVLCDTLGSLTAVGFEAAATFEATESAVELGVANSAKGQEEHEASVAAEMEGEAIEEQAAADADRKEATSRTQQAEAERAEAETNERAAKEKLVESAAERDNAAAASAESVEDETLANAAAKQALQHGFRAVWWVVLQVVLAVTGVAFLALQMVINLRGPGGRSSSSMSFRSSLRPFLLRSAWVISLCACTIFLLLWGADFALSSVDPTSPSIPGAPSTSSQSHPDADPRTVIRRRGAVVLRLTLAASSLQAILLHGPRWYICSSLRQCHPTDPWRFTGRVVSELMLVLGWTTFAAVLLFQSSNEQARLGSRSRTQVAFVLAFGLATIVCHHWLFWKLCQSIDGLPPMFDADLIAEAKLVEQRDDTTSPICGYEELLSEDAPLLGTRGLKDRPATHSIRGTLDVWTPCHQWLLDLLVSTVFATLLCSTLVQAYLLRPFWRPAVQALVAPLLHWLGGWGYWVALGSSAVLLLFLVWIHLRRICR